MTFTAILVIAIALAIDSFAVSLSAGLRLPRVTVGQTLKIGGTFGFFQFIMPLIGWWMGAEAQAYISRFDHWIAFALLAFVGLRMIWESWQNRGKNTAEHEFADPTDNNTLLMLGIATSLDALAVGLSFGLLSTAVWMPAVVIGIVCFIISASGLHMGRLITRLPGLASLGNHANAAGGIVLILIGLNILFQHGALL